LYPARQIRASIDIEMTSSLTRRIWLAGLGAACGGVTAAQAADWKNAAFPNWSEDAVMRLLVDSPWAHSRMVKLTWFGRKEAAGTITYRDIPGTRPGTPASSTAVGGSPVGGIGSGKVRNKLPDTADLIFRWASALPVRQAKALYRAREQGEAAKAPGLVESRGSSGSYAFEIFGLPTVAAHAGTEAISARLIKSAAIRTRVGRTIRAERAQTEVTGEQLTSTIYFPRTEPVRLDDQEIEVLGDGDLFEFRERFKLRGMRYLDSLEF
jgi:hypothetical protein